jgi:hypothetical protein
MRRAIAKQSRVRTVDNRCSPTNAERRSSSALRAPLSEPATTSLVAKDNGVLP